MITSISNPKVKRIRALQTRRRTRWQEKHYVIEGLQMSYEVVKAGLPTDLVLHTDHLNARGKGLVNSLARLGAEVEPVSNEIMMACSETETPSGLLVVLPMPDLVPPEDANFVIVLDQVADPGNLGTIMRTAIAVGAQSIYLTKGTVDPYNPKVVRGAMGAHMHIPIAYFGDGSISNHLRGLQLWIAEQGHGVPYYNVDWHEPIALAIGSEANGVSDELRSIAHGGVHIPMHGEIESLNAGIAAGVILFEISRQREQT
jgi:TrmH family RNA methyltransferase